MDIPTRLIGYRCSDYFSSEQFTRGIWSDSEQSWLIIPADEVFEQSHRRFLVIGRPGVDGIELGYRSGTDGIWAYYPIDDEFRLVAPNINALIEGWFGGTIKV